jgi:hypothetical protein
MLVSDPRPVDARRWTVEALDAANGMFRAAGMSPHRPPSSVAHRAGDGHLFLVTFIIIFLVVLLVIVIEVILIFIFVVGPVLFFIGSVVEVLDVTVIVVEVVIGEHLMLGFCQRRALARELALGGLVPVTELLGIYRTTGLGRTVVGHGGVSVS